MIESRCITNSAVSRAQGFEAQGNEFSYYMLIASAFVLNGMDTPRQWTVFPWAHSSCNQPSDADQLRPVRHSIAYLTACN